MACLQILSMAWALTASAAAATRQGTASELALQGRGKWRQRHARKVATGERKLCGRGIQRRAHQLRAQPTHKDEAFHDERGWVGGCRNPRASRNIGSYDSSLRHVLPWYNIPGSYHLRYQHQPSPAFSRHSIIASCMGQWHYRPSCACALCVHRLVDSLILRRSLTGERLSARSRTLQQ